jgi:hypothetical protein
MYTPYPILVYIWGRLLVTIKVQIHTLAAAKGPETERRVVGNISEEIIHGRPFGPKLQKNAKSMIIAVAAFPPATVESDMGWPMAGLPMLM